MKKINLRSFRVRVILLILAMLFAVAISDFFIYRFVVKSQFNQLRDKLMIIAQTAALNIEPDMLMKIPLNPQGKSTPEFKIIDNKLKKIQKANPAITYVYILTKTDQEGIWQFMVDAETHKGKAEETEAANPGDKYDASRFPQMLKGYEGPAADKKLLIDEWGVSLSGYAPIRDESGKTLAVLGVDIMADDVYNTQREVNRRVLLILVFGFLLSIGTGALFSKGVIDPVGKLAEGTHRIATGDLQYRVEVKGTDEFRELSASFNRMAASLSEARKKLHDYYYRIVQTLIRSIEAKDPYTGGHSERVAEYSEKIAVKLGLSAEKVAALKKAASLHDIGKIGIFESILNKQGRLTDEEWEVIKKHPVVGEEILKPVFLDDEMLTIIREHHEHLDGSGYPDKLSGQKINIFAKIVSVADAYDAMTSSRAYRPALGKEKAIEELKKQRGIQFDPEVVDAFIKTLQERT
jgi:putative nucleotidyltransferase with HDIG domain